MHKALDELKAQAKILLKSIRSNNPHAIQRLAKYSDKKIHSEPLELTYAEIAKLKHCQHVVSRERGFNHWRHAHSVLSRSNTHDEAHLNIKIDMGTLWHGQACHGLTNHWFTNYQEARSMLESSSDDYLIPYKLQFIVVSQEYMEALGLYQILKRLWKETGRNLVAIYGQSAWDEIAYARLRNQSQ